VSLSHRGYFSGEENLSWSSRTDGTGRFNFPALPACRSFVLRASGPAIPLFQAIDVVATGLTPRHLGEIRVPPGVCRWGKAVDAEGKPVAGASVRLLAWRNARPPDALYGFTGSGFAEVSTAATDLEGRFSVWASATDGEAVVKVEAPGFAPWADVVRLSDQDPCEAVLARSTSMAGRVVDELGAPAAGIEVSAIPRLSGAPAWNSLLSRKGYSAADGRIVIEGILESETYHLLNSFRRPMTSW